MRAGVQAQVEMTDIGGGAVGEFAGMLEGEFPVSGPNRNLGMEGAGDVKENAHG